MTEMDTVRAKNGRTAPDRRAPPVASSRDVADRMAKVRRRDTKPELELRRRLHAMGLRFRVDRAVLSDRRKRVDIVFGPARVAVLVDGCFWHGCPEHGVAPKANAEFWKDKIDRNKTRDRETDARLAADGWLVVRVWEHEDPDHAAANIARLVRRRRPRR